MTINVPFAFRVGDHSLPAGQYHIFTTVTQDAELSILITDTNG
jgi:hypothetical protein